MKVPLLETVDAISACLRESQCDAKFNEIINNIAAPDVRSILIPLLETRASGEQYQALLTKQDSLRRAAFSAHQKYRTHAVIMPTTILTAPHDNIGEQVKVNGKFLDTFQAYIRNTAPSAILGVPSVTIPAGFTTAGLPVGLQMDGTPGGDIQLLMHARRCMQLLHPVIA